MITKLYYLSICMTLVSCGGQKGKDKPVEQTILDVVPPKLVGTPNIERIRPDAADIVLTFNEQVNASLVVRAKTSLALNQAEILTAKDQVKFAAKPFTTTRLSLTKLKAGSDLTVQITAEDLSGNKMSEIVSTNFTTLTEVLPSFLGGTPQAAKQGIDWQFSPDGVLDGCQIKIDTAPEWIKVSDDGMSVYGIPQWQIGQQEFSFTLKLLGTQCQDEKKFVVPIVGDPLYDYAWHLNSASNKSFSWYSGAATNYALGHSPLLGKLTGQGVSVTIVDSGMQVNHPEFKDRIDFNKNINLAAVLGGECDVCTSFDTTPPLKPGENGDQGTAVAGIVGAAGWNGEGSRGVAPGVKLSAYNLSSPRFKDRITSIEYQTTTVINSDIICHSAAKDQSILTAQDQFDFNAFDIGQQLRVQNGRNNLGPIFLKAAGDLHTQGGNANFEQLNTTPWGMVIGSYNNVGVKSFHANSGSNLWISAPGGERGYQSNYDRISGASLLDFYPSVVSTNIFNPEFPCQMGFAKDPKYFDDDIERELLKNFSKGAVSGFNLGWHPLNKDCLYSASLEATPAATGVVAGVVALMLEANPKLTWRQVKYILAKTAKPIDTDFKSEITNILASPYERTQGWIKNSAGYRFHNWYGFGAIDLAKALEMATSDQLKHFLPLVDTGWRFTGTEFPVIPQGDIGGVTNDFSQGINLFIESVQVRVNITHPDMSRIGIELISPNGTKSILKAIKDGANYANMDDVVFTSNAFYGERSRGRWQLKVVDSKKTEFGGSINDWNIRITGTTANEGEE